MMAYILAVAISCSSCSWAYNVCVEQARAEFTRLFQAGPWAAWRGYAAAKEACAESYTRCLTDGCEP